MTEKKVRKDKKSKVLVGLNQTDHEKLQKLAVSCNMTKTKLAEHILALALNSENHVQWYQDRFNKDDKYRIILVKTSDGIEYH